MQGASSSSALGSKEKPEWKRYKQYTRNDILQAIECVRNGMSALQASRKFGVPSRTLYDKVKKMGITTGTPRSRSMKRESGSSGGSAAFPYNLNSSFLYPAQDNQLSQSQDVSDRNDVEELKHHHAMQHSALLDPNFLQQALEARGGDALHAMALAAAAHAAVNGMSSHHEQRRDGNPSSRSPPSPSVLMKYMNNRHAEQELEDARLGEFLSLP